MNKNNDITIEKINILKNMLKMCCIEQGANISIAIEHTNGTKVEVDLYDHANLVQNLISSLDELVDEL